MTERFQEGFIFGAGFGVAFICIWYLAALLTIPVFKAFGSAATTASWTADDDAAGEAPAVAAGRGGKGGKPRPLREDPHPGFHDLAVDQKIDASTVIVLARYQPETDGRMAAIITEVLKNEPGSGFDFKVGDEYPPVSYYKDESNRGEGAVVFFSGKPAYQMSSASYTGDTIAGLQYIPMTLFLEKIGKRG